MARQQLGVKHRFSESSFVELSPLDTEQQLTQWRHRIEAALDQYSQLDSESPDLLTEAIRYSLLGNGKRLRPLLVLAACDACGGTVEAALPAACAVEMIHAYSLVHDDLPGMDDDDLRRGRPTCHIQFNHATAILVGDSLQSLAFELLARELSAERAVRCVALLASAAGPRGMAGGQQDDLTAESVEPSEELLLRIHRRKTGALLAVSLEIGGVIAGANELQLENLRQFGQNMGLAFQVTDDLLDVAGDSDTVGKRTGKDLDRGKLTFPGLFGVPKSRERANQLIQSAQQNLDSFGQRGDVLRAIARFVLERQQ